MPYPNKWGVNSGVALFRLDRLRETGWAVAIDNIMTQVRHVTLGISRCAAQGTKACLPPLHPFCFAHTSCTTSHPPWVDQPNS